MQVTKLEGRVIYRPSKGKKVKFAHGGELKNEIAVKEGSSLKVVEVKI